VNPDAHAVNEFENVSFGINVAKKTSLTAREVLNTKSVAAMKAFLQRACP
jgi:hypothetical protein